MAKQLLVVGGGGGGGIDSFTLPPPRIQITNLVTIGVPTWPKHIYTETCVSGCGGWKTSMKWVRCHSL